ncbi:hypothetical protein TNCV_1215291, partial [Trichonephila clavipes]
MSWFEPSTAEDHSVFSGPMQLNMSKLKCSPVGVVWKLREKEASAQVSSLSLDYGSELRS